MVFNSLMFIIVFPFIVLLYYCIPQKWKIGCLFLVSLGFYACFEWKYLFLLLGVILLSFFSATWMEGKNQKEKNFIMAADVIAVAGMLLLFKCLSLGSVSLPIGISFYALVALGYVIDVYRGKEKAEKSLVKYGAFVSFFPPLLSGPIERADNLLRQMKLPQRFSEEKIRRGICQMLWGYFQKVVIANRIAVIVDAVYNDYEAYTGIYVLVATVLYAFQIYCDFAGYSNLAIGAARILGFELKENFKVPYLATSVAQFWERWHISLSTWLRDYVYISLGGNRRGKWKKYRNLLVTFLVSGLWHGFNWTFMIWGALHGVYRILNDMVANKWNAWKGFAAKLIKTAVTFILVDFAWLFFRANSVGAAFSLIRKMLTDFNLLSILNREMAISMGMEIADIAVLVFALFVLVVVDLTGDKLRYREKICRLPLPLRWLVLYAAIFIVLIFGYYGPGFSAGQFIYAQF